MQVAITSSEEQVVEALKAIGDETRFKIFKLLLGSRELYVSNIAEQLGYRFQPYPSTSDFLNMLV